MRTSSWPANISIVDTIYAASVRYIGIMIETQYEHVNAQADKNDDNLVREPHSSGE